MNDIQEKLKQFIYQLVKENTSPEKPYFYIRGSGLSELCQKYQQNLLNLIDQMVKEKIVKKGLVNNRLVLYIYQPINKRRLEQIDKQFREFLENN